MIKITKENFENIDFKGIIVGVPKNPELNFEFSINFECAYRTDGKHGYPEKGSNPDNSSFFSIYYNDEYLPNGLFFNCTSRLPWKLDYHYLNNVDYYKFDDMEEFCKWYLEQKQSKTLKAVQGLVWNGQEYIEPPKPTRRERLNEVIEYLHKYEEICRLRDSVRKGTIRDEDYKCAIANFEDWLDSID